MTASTVSSLPAHELTAGDKAPNVNLIADGNATINLADLKGKKNVVLYFYPKDDTPGCTVEAKDFGAALRDFEKADTVIFGVSKDSVQSHEKFKEKYCLPFQLLSDSQGDVCDAYGVWVEKSMYGKAYMGIDRSTFLIDKTGTIRHLWRKVKVDGHAQEVLKAAQGL